VTEHSLMAVLVEKAIDVIPTIMFIVVWMRLVLLGPGGSGACRARLVAARDRLPDPPDPGRRHHLRADRRLHPDARARSIRRRSARAVDPDMMRREAMAAPLGTGFVASAVLALRVSFGSPRPRSTCRGRRAARGPTAAAIPGRSSRRCS
jgi:hypothetical protein